MSEPAVTIEDYHAHKVGQAVLQALTEVDGDLWFDVGVALVTNPEVQEAIRDASDPGRLGSEERATMQDDIGAILEALGLGDHARTYSPHEVVQREILPAIRELTGDQP